MKRLTSVLKDVFNQIWLDIRGKEVQEAATYSYYWLAGQVAHTGLLIAIYIIVFECVSLFDALSFVTNNVIAIVLFVLVTLWGNKICSSYQED